jgi:hypothetical protein
MEKSNEHEGHSLKPSGIAGDCKSHSSLSVCTNISRNSHIVKKGTSGIKKNSGKILI